MTKPALILAAGLLGAAGITARAFEAHGLLALPDISEPRLRDFSSGTEILLIQALAMLGVAGVSETLPRLSRWVGIVFTIGVILFTVPLLSYGISGSRTLIMLTPFGGVALILGWVLLAIGGALGFAKRRGAS